MTFDEIVTEVAEQLNLTSAEAIARIERRVNRRYRRVTGDCGVLVTGRFDPDVAETVTIGNRAVTFDAVEKLVTVRDDNDPQRHLTEVSFVELQEMQLRESSDAPLFFAVVNSTATTITVWLDAEPETAYDLHAAAIVSAAVLADDDEPDIPASYHDILIAGSLADELRKSEKFREAEIHEAEFTKRLNELKLHLRSSASLQAQQNKLNREPRYLRRR